jgi:hypothetical protein
MGKCENKSVIFCNEEGENPEDDTGVRVKGSKKAGEEELRLACTRRTPDEDEDEENCIMTVLYT